MRTRLRHLALFAALAAAPTIGMAQTGTSTAGAAPVQAGSAAPVQNTGNVGGQATAQGTRSTASPLQINPGATGQVQAAGRPAGQGQAGQVQGGMSVAAFLAHALRQGNQAEVELGKLASEKAKSDSVKEFAQMMVKSHTEMIQKIDQANVRNGQPGGQPGAGGPQGRQGLRQLVGQSEPSAKAATTLTTTPVQTGSNVRNSQSNTNGEERAVTPPGGTSQASSAAGQAGGATPGGSSTPGAATTANPGINPNIRPGQAGVVTAAQATAQPAGQPAVQAAPGAGRGRGMGNRVPQQLIAVVDQAGDNELQMTKEMLQKYEGEDFDMGYIGQQIVAHTCMLAKLQAIKSSGPDELGQLVTEAEQATREHLDKAKKIAHDLAGKK
jgi:predicted outer membrane protein